MEEVDEAAHRVVMRASGQDKRGQGSAKAAIVSTMSEAAGVTTVEVETDFTITGRLARFGRGGMIQDVSNRLLRDFSDCLQKTIEAAAPDAGRAGRRAEPPPPAKPVGGFSLVLRALWDRIRRLLRTRALTHPRSSARKAGSIVCAIGDSRYVTSAPALVSRSRASRPKSTEMTGS